MELPGGTVYEYKYVLLDSYSGHALSWQRGNNSVLAIKAGEESVEVRIPESEFESRHSLKCPNFYDSQMASA